MRISIGCKDWRMCTSNLAHEAVYKDNHLLDCG
jgi:hypothetical protein